MTRLTLTYESGLLSVDSDGLMPDDVVPIVTATIGDAPEDGNDGGPWVFDWARWYARPKDIERVLTALTSAGHEATFEWPAISKEQLDALERMAMDGYEIGAMDALCLIRTIKKGDPR